MTVAIETKQLTKRYGSARGIEQLDLTVEAGQVFGFLGPNGSGKSTMIRTLLDFQRPTSGTATVLGLDSTRDSVAIRRRVGYLPGDLRLFEAMTGAGHLELFGRARGGFGASITDALVERFAVTLDRPARELSKGNRQKIGILLAFAHQPELLVLDEPTSGLDPLVQLEFSELIRETARAGRTVLLSSHSLDDVQRAADRVAIIRDGRLVAEDSVDHLRLSAPRVMVLHFSGPAEVDVFATLPGVVSATARGNDVHLQLNGDVRRVLTEALARGMNDLTARPADLEELFLTYFRHPTGQQESP